MSEKLVFDVYNIPHLQNVCRELTQKIKAGKRYVLKLDEVTKRKSHKQLRNLFGNLVTPLAEYLSASYGIDIDSLALERELLKRYDVQAESPTCKFSFDFERMSPDIVPTRLLDMNTAQAGDFTDWCITYIRERFPDLNLPPYIDYLWMNKLTEEKVKQVVYESQKWGDRDKEYLEHIRSKPCIVCGVVSQKREVHHLNDITLGGGMAEKVPDYYTVPLCRECHQALHDQGMKELEVLIAPMLHGQGINVFCKVCYYRWKNHL